MKYDLQEGVVRAKSGSTFSLKCINKKPRYADGKFMPYRKEQKLMKRRARAKRGIKLSTLFEYSFCLFLLAVGIYSYVIS